MAIRFNCPTCGTNLSARDEDEGKKVACPKCKGRAVVPDPLEGLGEIAVEATRQPHKHTQRASAIAGLLLLVIVLAAGVAAITSSAIWTFLQQPTTPPVAPRPTARAATDDAPTIEALAALQHRLESIERALKKHREAIELTADMFETEVQHLENPGRYGVRVRRPDYSAEIKSVFSN